MENIARALAESGWDVDVLSPASHEGKSAGISEVSYTEFKYDEPSSSPEIMLNTVRGVRTFRQLSETREFDVILDDVSHYPYYPAHFLCPEGATNSIFMHIAFFGAAREYLGPFRGTVIDLIDRTLPRLNNPEIVCAGESTQERIHNGTGYKRTRVLHPTVRPEAFEYQFDPDARTVLYLGRLDARKNVASLLRAWKRVEQRSNRDLSLLIAGKGPRERALHELAADLGLQNVRFLGYVDESEKRRLFSEALLYIIPSKMEGYVTTGLEALASGTPVVGADTFGINDYIAHGESGYLFPVNDDKRLAELLMELTDDPEHLRPVAEAGRELADEHVFDKFKENANEIFSLIAQS
jgi:glycosyltransferase involved in cell wall biosynthesis